MNPLINGFKYEYLFLAAISHPNTLYIFHCCKMNFTKSHYLIYCTNLLTKWICGLYPHTLLVFLFLLFLILKIWNGSKDFTEKQKAPPLCRQYFFYSNHIKLTKNMPNFHKFSNNFNQIIQFRCTKQLLCLWIISYIYIKKNGKSNKLPSPTQYSIQTENGVLLCANAR